MARKEYKIHYIYKTTCIVTGKYYIGMHSTFNEDDSYIGSGKRLWYSIRKHGKENHVKEIVEYCLDRSSLKVREKEIVNEELLNDKMCMNLKLGGEGGFPLHCAFGNIDKEIQFKRSQSGGLAFSKKCKENPEIDKEHRDKLSQRIKEKWTNPEYRNSIISSQKKTFENKIWNFTEDHKKKISEANKISQSGSRNSQFGSKWINKAGESKKIKSDDLEKYIEDGWKLGLSDERKELIKNRLKEKSN